jgi:hypothetical protein
MSSLAVGSPDPGFGLSPRRLTLVDLLEWRAQSQAERVAYTFLGESETERISLTGAELQRKAQLIGQRLVSLDAAGKTVLLLYPSDLEYVAAFFGCLYAGATAKHYLVNEGHYLPMGYKRLRLKGPLPRKIHAYIRAKDSGSRNETITFDITLLDEEGVERVVIDSFSQKRVNDATGTIKLLAGTGARKDSAPETTAQNGTTAEGAETIYQRSLSEGIAPEEGVEAFRRILAHGRLPQVIVSTKNLHASIEQVNNFAQTNLAGVADSEPAARAAHPRPADLRTPYVAPRNDRTHNLRHFRFSSQRQGDFGCSALGL